MAELVTRNSGDYLDRAIALARDPGALAALRQRLRANRLSTPLFDTAAFARDFEALLRLIWRDHSAGRPAKVLALEPGPTVANAP